MYFTSTKCRLFILSCFAASTLNAKDIKPTTAPQFKKPVCFLENKGQIRDLNHKQRQDIDFKLASNGVGLYIGAGALHYQFKKVNTHQDQTDISLCEMNVTLVGANQHAQPIASNIINYVENYYYDDGSYTANAYKKITYKDIYPNIDWTVYVVNDKVEYDFIVHEGGRPEDIKIAYDGATDLAIQADGSLLATTPMGTIKEHQPISFEANTHRKVKTSFQLDHNIVSFHTDAYKGGLTIDPYLAWCTYFGGTNEDVVTSIDASAGGNFYFAGYTASTGLGVGTGITFQLTYGGGAGPYDAFAARLNATGTTIGWCSYWGGTGDDRANALTLSGSGNNTFIVGSTTSNGGFLANRNNFTNSGGIDIFICNFNSTNGQRTWSLFDGGTGNDIGNGIALDPGGNLYIGGTTSSTGMSSDGTSLTGRLDGYIAKISTTGFGGGYIWSTYINGNNDDSLTDIAVDGASNVALTGVTNSTSGIATSGSYATSLNGASDAFIMRYNSGGAKLWGSYFGGSGNEVGQGVDVESAAPYNIFVVGSTTSAAGITSGLVHQATYGGGSSDAFLAKMNVSGAAPIWSTYIGGTGTDAAYSVRYDGNTNIILGGITNSASGVATAQGYQTTIGGGFDAFVHKFNTLGQNIYGTYFGGPGNDALYALTPDAVTGNRVAIVGATTSTSGMTTGGVLRTTYAGGTSDGFIAVFSPDTLVRINQPFTDTLLCINGTFTVRYTTNVNFAAGNSFTVQLSDVTGSFASAVNIGAVSSSTSGTITCTIPAGTPPGSNYRIRIASGNPAYISPDNIYNITILAALPPLTITANNPICVGYTLNLSATASFPATAYSWSGPGAFTAATSATSRTSITAAQAGYYVASASRAGCPARRDSVNITVSTVIPLRPFDSTNAPLCAGGTLRLFSWPDTTITGTYSYSWIGPAGFTSTLQNPILTGITTANTGPYFIQDTLNGCASPMNSIYVNIIRADTPNIIISVAPNDTLCYGTMADFTSIITNAGTSPTFQWYSAAGVPIVGATYNYFSSASLSGLMGIRCVMTPDGSIPCPDKPRDTSNIINMNIMNNTPMVTIAATPDSMVLPGGTVSFIASVGGFGITGYQWYVNNVAIAGATSATYTRTNIRSNDRVRVEVTSSAMCANIGVSNTITTRITTDVANVSPSFDALQLFPNPNNGTFQISGNISQLTDGKATIVITNAIGQVLYHQSTSVINQHIDAPIQIEHLPVGTYMLRISKDQEGKTFRFNVVD